MVAPAFPVTDGATAELEDVVDLEGDCVLLEETDGDPEVIPVGEVVNTAEEAELDDISDELMAELELVC